MTDIRKAILLVEGEKARFTAILGPGAPERDFATWKKVYDAAVAETTSSLKSVGAAVQSDYRGTSIKFVGIRSSSTSGLGGAMNNWLAAARKKLEAQS